MVNAPPPPQSVSHKLVHALWRVLALEKRKKEEISKDRKGVIVLITELVVRPRLCVDSGRDRSPVERGNFLLNEAEQVLRQTISERVKDHLPNSDRDEDKDTDASQGQSERETESMSEFSSGALDEGYVTVRKASSKSKTTTSKEKSKGKEQTVSKRPADNDTSSSSGGEAKKPAESSAKEASAEKTVKINIKRPKDYFLQWEETIDRLSHGPPVPPDVSDMSPRSPREILRGIEGARSPRSRSLSAESDVYGGPYTPVWKRREYFEKRSGSLSPSVQYREPRYPARSSSMPLETSGGRSSERRQSPSPGPAGRSGRKSAQVRQIDASDEPTRESPRNGQSSRSAERRSPTESSQRQGDSGRQGPPAQADDGSSNFMERLEELKRSGRAQRVILPDLGPDAPVLMIPGQGEEVLLLFDALRQARLEVNLNMPKPNGASNATSNGTANGSRSAARTSPIQALEETDLKKVAKAEKANGSTSRKSPTLEEEKDTVGSLPRPTTHRHRFSKPTDIRVADLRSGRLMDHRRTQSLTERQATSPLAAASESSRYHSLSPRREQSSARSSEHTDSVARSPAERNGIAFRGVGTERVDALVDAPVRSYASGRDSAPSPVHRSYTSSPSALRASPYSSPYRQAASHTSYDNSSPLRVASPRRSPRVDGTPERLPPLELPDDLASPRPRVGGLGRVPRREAWERQRQRKEPKPFDASGVDSLAQAKFIEVLCKEIEELKQKIEIMEDSQAESSPERGSPARGRPATGTGYTSTSTGQNDTYYTMRSEIQETESKMLLAPREGSPRLAAQRSFQSPRPWDASRSSTSPLRGSPRLRPGLASLSPRRHYGRDSPTVDRTRGRQSPSPDRSRAEDLSPRKKTGAEASQPVGYPNSPVDNVSQISQADLTDAKTSGRISPSRAGRGISLGYKSPIRSVTQEIWGKDLTSVEGLEPDRRDKYKRLISQRSLAEEDVIELKQALASAVVENDILQAKLNNARHEIQDKLSKTNEVSLT